MDSKRAYFALLILPVLMVACGVNYRTLSSTSESAISSGKITISGDIMVQQPASPKSFRRQNNVRISPMAGGKVQAISSRGAVLASAEIGSDGSYHLEVDKGANYIFSANKGNVCLRSFSPTVFSDATVGIDPSTSAIVKVLSKKLGRDDFGEIDADVSGVVLATDMSALVSAISKSASLDSVSSAIEADIAANADYASTTLSAGVVSTVADDVARTLALEINVDIGVLVDGQIVNALTAPGGLSAQAGDGSVTLAWDAVDGATSYVVYYSTSSTHAGDRVSGISGTTGYTVEGLVNGTTYFFVVTVEREGLESPCSIKIGATPSAPVPGIPSGIKAVAENGAAATITWEPVPGATSYNLYWSNQYGVTAASSKITNVSSPYTHTGLANGSTYYYRLSVVTGQGESALSMEVSVTPSLAAPTGVTALYGDGEITIRWDATPGASAYTVYWSASQGVTKAAEGKAEGLTGTSYTITGLSAGTMYYAAVSASNDGGESPLSAEMAEIASRVVLLQWLRFTAPYTVLVDGANIYVVDRQFGLTQLRKTGLTSSDYGTQLYRTVAFSDNSHPQVVALDASFVYFVMGTAITKVPIGGGAFITLAQEEIYPPSAIVIYGNTLFYMISPNLAPGLALAQLKSVNLTTGQVDTLHSGDYQATSIAVNTTTICWNDVRVFSIHCLPRAGGMVSSTWLQYFPKSLAMDATDLYWGEGAPGGSIKKRPAQGGAVEVLASGPSVEASIVLDSANIYWVGYLSSDGFPKVLRTPKSGGASAVVFAGDDIDLSGRMPQLMGLALDNTSLYVTAMYPEFWEGSLYKTIK